MPRAEQGLLESSRLLVYHCVVGLRGVLVYPISLDHPGNRGIINKMQYQWDAFSALTSRVDDVCSSKQGPVLADSNFKRPFSRTGKSA